MTGTSPPGPFMCGSTTCSTRPAATAASNAFPSCSSTAIPAAEASQCVEATMPKVPASSGRVVNGDVIAPDVSAGRVRPDEPARDLRAVPSDRMEELSPRLRAVCDLPVAEVREYERPS